MTEAEQLARHYFDLSNNRKLDAIKNLFTPSSTYSSITTGVFLGSDQIMQMQSGFFAKFVSMHWEVHRVLETAPGVILFDFTFSGRTTDSKFVQNDGLEYVVVHNGKIQHVEVRQKN